MTLYVPTTKGFTSTVGHISRVRRPYVISRVVNFANVKTGGLTTSDTLKALYIPAKTMVMTAGYNTITTVLSASGTFDIHDGTVAYCAATTAVAAGSYGARPSISATTTDVLYSTAGYIGIANVAVATLASGIIRIFAVLADLDDEETVDNATWG